MSEEVDTIDQRLRLELAAQLDVDGIIVFRICMLSSTMQISTNTMISGI